MLSTNNLWLSAPGTLTILPSEVHLWRTSLSQSPERINEFARTLSRDEKARAQRFRFEKDRSHFKVGRGMLRLLLGFYMGIEPAQVVFSYGEQGKPMLSGNNEKFDICFNMSHSCEMAVYAFTLGVHVGVDLESIRQVKDMEKVAQQFFARDEYEEILSFPEEERLEAFFCCWTRKEAYIKAIGEGLHRPLDTFRVSVAPGAPARLLRVNDDKGGISRWSLKSFSPGTGYAAAVAAAAHIEHYKFWQRAV